MSSERRFDRGSWLALGFALFLICWNLILASLTWGIPGDGWQLTGDENAEPSQLYFLYNYNLGPTPLEQGDILLTVEGLTPKEVIARGFKFFHVQAPAWGEGTVLHYTVRRADQVLTLNVPQHIFSIWELFVGPFRILPAQSLVQLLSSPFFFIVGLVVFLLRPRNRAAHALLILGTMFLLTILPYANWVSARFYPFPPASIPFDGWTIAINPSIMYMALSFPAPKLPIRRFPRLTVAFLYLSAPIALNLAYWLNPDNPPAYSNLSSMVYVAQILMVFVVAFGSVIHSALTLRDSVQRAQLKWVALGLASFIVPGIGGWLLGYLGIVFDWVYFLSVTGWFLFPISISIAITRYKLFDIDIIIRRTISYGLLTGALLLVFFGSVILLQQFFSSLTGSSQNELVTVLSTLAIAALFGPLRNRIQEAIDKRFNRRKYDAQQVLASFAATARDETDLGKLTGRLVEVVQETMQPTRASVWLKRTDDRRARTGR